MIKYSKRLLLTATFLVGCSFYSSSFAESKYFGHDLCKNPDYKCVTVRRGQSWEQMFPNPTHRDLVQRINRTNMYLWRGRKIAVPHNLDQLDIYDVSPFETTIESDNEKVIIVDQVRLAWGAYDEDGKLVKWGPISSGKNYCKDINRSCKTKTGMFHIFSKKNERCRSNQYPVGRGGSHMPYCMFFFRGYALHGSPFVTGSRDSHGCIRLFTKDAKWLNEEFVDITDNDELTQGTKVIVQELIESG